MSEAKPMRTEGSGEPGQQAGDIWRNEVHARLARYRTRRGRHIGGAYTMRFAFPAYEAPGSKSSLDAEAVPAEPALPPVDLRPPGELLASLPAEAGRVPEDSPPALEAASAELIQQTVEPAPTVPERTLAPVAPRPRPKRKVIAFPRQPDVSHLANRLADPVLPEQPRILDVPEELEAFPTTPFLDGLQFGPAPQSIAAAQSDALELPLPPASVSRRIVAALADGAVIGIATVIFGAVSYKLLPRIELSRSILLMAATIPVMLWASYQYLLTVYGGVTLGMRLAKVRLSSFQGRVPRVRDRRMRVLSLLLSTSSIGMGLLWAFVDVDALCWHDRISRTYLVVRQ